MNLLITKYNRKHLKELKKIYNNSFPKEEKFPMWLLLFNLHRNNSELYTLFAHNELCGFIYLINYKNMCFILYLAIDNLKRNKGYGSYILNWCLNYKKDKDIYLNIEEVNNQFEDFKYREKRLKFYLSNGFYLTNYLSVEKCIKFNILSTNKKIDINEYKELDKKISRWFFNMKSKIVEVNNENS